MNEKFCRPHEASRSAQRGLTLIEMMAAVAIVAVLASLAYAGYADQVQRGRRALAKATLTEAALWLERARAEQGRYDRDAQGVPLELPARLRRVPAEPADAQWYAIEISAIDAASFVLTARPAGLMQGDRCGMLSLDHLGRKSLFGAIASVPDCWGR